MLYTKSIPLKSEKKLNGCSNGKPNQILIEKLSSPHTRINYTRLEHENGDKRMIAVIWLRAIRYQTRYNSHLINSI